MSYLELPPEIDPYDLAHDLAFDAYRLQHEATMSHDEYMLRNPVGEQPTRQEAMQGYFKTREMLRSMNIKQGDITHLFTWAKYVLHETMKFESELAFIDPIDFELHNFFEAAKKEQ